MENFLNLLRGLWALALLLALFFCVFIGLSAISNATRPLTEEELKEASLIQWKTLAYASAAAFFSLANIFRHAMNEELQKFKKAS